MSITRNSHTTYSSGASATTSVVLDKPASTTAGTYLQAWIYLYGSAPSAPTGWTLATSYVSGSRRYYVYEKVAGDSEPDTYTWTFASSRASGVCIPFEGVGAVHLTTDNYGGADRTATYLGGSVTTDGCLVVAGCGLYRTIDVSISTPTDFTLIEKLPLQTLQGLFDKAQDTGTLGNFTSTLGSSVYWTTLVVVLEPAATGTTYNESASLGASAGLDPAPALELNPSLNLQVSADVGHSPAGSTYNPSTVFQTQADFTLTSEGLLSAVLTLAAQAAQAQAGGSEFTETLSLEVSAIQGQESNLNIPVAIALSGQAGFTPLAIAELFNSIVLNSQPAITTSAILEIMASLGLSTSALITAAVSLDIYKTLSLQAVSTITVGGEIVVGGVVYEESLTLTTQAGLGLAHQLSMAQNLLFQINTSLGVDSQWEGNIAISFGSTAAMNAVIEGEAKPTYYIIFQRRRKAG
jgi:hypothetical protein